MEFTEAFHPNVDELRFGTAAFEGANLFRTAVETLAPKAEVPARAARKIIIMNFFVILRSCKETSLHHCFILSTEVSMPS
jgi:hypothetical protein